VKSWINTWSKDTDSPAAPASKRRMLTKPTIKISYDSEREAYLIDEGPEVSEIRWADTGQHQFMPNKYLVK
jgi:hypothetical protein